MCWPGVTSERFEVSALGLGCMGMSQSYGAADERGVASPPSTAPSSWA